MPARGGSKGIPRKCIAAVAGRPLLAWTADAALAAASLDRVLLSTDDDEIAAVGEDLGLAVTFRRPPALAADDTPMTAVTSHALEWCRSEGIDVGAIVLLQPTSPLRRPEHIDEAVALLADTGAESVVSVVAVPHQYNPVSILQRSGAGFLERWNDDGPLVTRRQDKPEVYARNGPAIVVNRAAVVARGDAYGEPLAGYVMSQLDSLDVDGPDDLVLVDLLLRDRLAS
ncbi:MAG: Acylneuraminate cytidylyltransferase [Acidimicrobiales bacterium]|nr:Acylneuraminate cytidylyltransferase [Acidimicrobiales bacterium]